MQVTFTKNELKKILDEPGHHVLINIGYKDNGHAHITAQSFHPQEKTTTALVASGCPFPPGCPSTKTNEA